MEEYNMPTFTNQAQLSYNGIITNSNVTSGQIIEVLSASKTSVFENYSSGGEVTYVINIVNSGTIPYRDLTVTDNLGSFELTTPTGGTITVNPLTYVDDSILYFSNGVEQPDPTVDTTNGLVISGIVVPANGNVTLVYVAETNPFTPLAEGSSITNTATISGADLGTPIEVTHTITALCEPYLTIFKSLSPRQVPANGQVTYSFEIQNLGNTATTAADNVRVLDTFLPILTNITVYYNGVVLPESNYTYNALTGEFATNAGVINVPAATFSRNPNTGEITTVPGEATLVITGTI